MRLALPLLLFLAACARPLTVGETEFADTLFGTTLATRQIRIAPFTALDKITATRPRRARVACRERIWPKPKTRTVTTYTAAFVLYNRINISKDIYLSDYMKKYPRVISLPAAMLIAHELTHVWQWQHRRETGYTPLKALNEHRAGNDPYLLNISTKTPFLDYPFEQQGAIIEEYVCCRTLDPNGARTKRLHTMLKGVFPLKRLSTPQPAAYIPWKGAKTRGICA